MRDRGEDPPVRTGVRDIEDSMEIPHALQPGDSAEGEVGEGMARRSRICSKPLFFSMRGRGRGGDSPWETGVGGIRPRIYCQPWCGQGSRRISGRDKKVARFGPPSGISPVYGQGPVYALRHMPT